MAIAVLGGHVSRALDFYDAPNKYFIIGGTNEEWEDELNPPSPDTKEFNLKDIVGLKKVPNGVLYTSMVVPLGKDATEYDISYRDEKWKRVEARIMTELAAPVSAGSSTIRLKSTEGLTTGSKIRIGDKYERIIESPDVLRENEDITLNEKIDEALDEGTLIIGGALVEGANYVYVQCSLDYAEFPVTFRNGEKYFYRQIGLCTNVIPQDDKEGADILLSSRFSSSGSDEFKSIGILEVLDNRPPTSRDDDQREMLSLVVEF